MQPQPQAPQQPPQKLLDFNEELKNLCDKYQYELFGRLQMFDDAIVTRLEVRDKSPKTQGVNLRPQIQQPIENPTPRTETPVDTAAPASA